MSNAPAAGPAAASAAASTRFAPSAATAVILKHLSAPAIQTRRQRPPVVLLPGRVSLLQPRCAATGSPPPPPPSAAAVTPLKFSGVNAVDGTPEQTKTTALVAEDVAAAPAAASVTAHMGFPDKGGAVATENGESGSSIKSIVDNNDELSSSAWCLDAGAGTNGRASPAQAAEIQPNAHHPVSDATALAAAAAAVSDGAGSSHATSLSDSRTEGYPWSPRPIANLGSRRRGHVGARGPVGGGGGGVFPGRGRGRSSPPGRGWRPTGDAAATAAANGARWRDSTEAASSRVHKPALAAAPGPAVLSSLLEELQDMQQQVSELTTMLAEQQQQMNILMQIVRKNGNLDATALASTLAAAAPASCGGGAITAAAEGTVGERKAAAEVGSPVDVANGSSVASTTPRVDLTAVSLAPARDGSSSNSRPNGGGDASTADGQVKTLQLAAPASAAAALQPELLALLEQELSDGGVGNSVSTSSSSIGSSGVPNGASRGAIHGVNGEAVSNSSCSSTGADEEARRASAPAAVAVAGGVVNPVGVTHESDDVQQELRHLLVKELETQNSAAVPTLADDPAAPSIETGSGTVAALVPPSPAPEVVSTEEAGVATAVAVAAQPHLGHPPSAHPLASTSESRCSDAAAKVAAAAVTVAAAESGDTSADGCAAQEPAGSADADGSKTAVASLGGSGDSGDSVTASGGAVAAVESLADEQELRDLVAQLMSVSSETIRLARVAKKAGLALPPELQKPAALPAALALLQRLRAAKEGATAVTDGAATVAAAALPPTSPSIVPESSAALTLQRAKNGDAGETRSRRLGGRAGGSDGIVRAASTVGRGAGHGIRAVRKDRSATPPPSQARPQALLAAVPEEPSPQSEPVMAAPLQPPAVAAVAAAAAQPQDLTPEQLAALRDHPSYMFQGLKRLSWEGEEPLAATVPPRQAPGQESPLPSLLAPPLHVDTRRSKMAARLQ